MILGIGFIMVAAVFPVALKQTEETAEETTAASVAHSGASYLQRFASANNFPATNGKVVNIGVAGTSIGVPFWQSVSGNLILSTDTRYAWIPFYSRPVVNQVAASYAQVTIIAVQCRNGNFTASDLVPMGKSVAGESSGSARKGDVYSGQWRQYPRQRDARIRYRGAGNSVAEHGRGRLHHRRRRQHRANQSCRFL